MIFFECYGLIYPPTVPRTVSYSMAPQKRRKREIRCSLSAWGGDTGVQLKNLFFNVVFGSFLAPLRCCCEHWEMDVSIYVWVSGPVLVCFHGLYCIVFLIFLITGLYFQENVCHQLPPPSICASMTFHLCVRNVCMYNMCVLGGVPERVCRDKGKEL